MKEFRHVKGFEHYLVSNHGRCKNTRTHRFVGRNNNQGKYVLLNLSDKGMNRQVSMHVLVCEAFKPNPKPGIYTKIDHIDENGSNNHIENLQWLTNGQNIMRSSKHK